jgi:hypothetical protein
MWTPLSSGPVSRSPQSAFFAFLDFSMPDCIFAFRFFSCKPHIQWDKHTDNARAV